ncbi:MAG TPA: phosphodiester glycosidase family protein [Mycobacteriales bacterium]|nr:phosphodiester glycosidase family protein [Mycobacteriales bacterium]
MTSAALARAVRHLSAGLGGVLMASVLPFLAAEPAFAAPGSSTGMRQVAASVTGGYDRLALRRNDTWLIRDGLGSGPVEVYHEDGGGWTPVSGDTDGDGMGTLSLFRDGVWHIRNSRQGVPTVIRFGQRGDRPIMGDWDGDGVDSIGVVRAGRWYIRNNSAYGPSRTFLFGLGTDRPVVGDWDGNGKTDIAMVRNSTWFQRDATSTGPHTRTFNFGQPGDHRFAGDWDHDGRDSPGVFRSGTWYLRESSVTGRYQSVYFGRAGDYPVVRRTPDLAAGLSHRVYRDTAGPVTAHVATLDLRAPSSPDTVLAQNRLPGLEPTSAMARRSGAVLAINGDYFQSTGRPVHAFAADGHLVQTPQLLGRAVGFDATGTQVQMGFPDVSTSVIASSSGTASTHLVPRFNSGVPQGHEIAAFTAAGGSLETPPHEGCYAGLNPAGSRVVRNDGVLQSPLQISGQRCGGPAPAVPAPTTILAGNGDHDGGAWLRGLTPGQPAELLSLLGFPGTVDLLGGNPLLIAEGTIQSQDVDQSGPFFDRNPRTAVGVTSAGELLLVVVDGRQPGYSVGMTLRELADFMAGLGAVNAINLDGGGSSTMWLNGIVANRVSDGRERAVGSSLVVLPGADSGERDITIAPPPATQNQSQGQQVPPAQQRLSRSPAGATEEPLVSPVRGAAPVPGWLDAARDPASVGGLADAMRRQGRSLGADLQRADAAYDASR